jgi:hypothetical protein
MASINELVDKRRDLKEKKIIFNENLQNSGLTVALSKAKYLGGHPDLLGERAGNITVKSTGVFFQVNAKYNFIFIPVEKIVKAEFQTGEQIAKNEALSRILAFSGFSFAFDKKSRERHMYLTITYREKEVESSILIECKNANRLASAITKIIQDCEKASKVTNDISLIELMKEISVLKAMSVITEEEYNEKKKELLSRI